MKVFVTGASGFIGSAVVKELLAAGHEVLGLARSDASAAALETAGAAVWRGNLEEPAGLQEAATQADGIIHLAFIHDFLHYAKAAETDKAAIEAMGQALQGTQKPLVVAAGILGLPLTSGFVTEADASSGGARASETAAMALAEAGVHAAVVRLPPSVHDAGDHGFIPMIIEMARGKGISAYVGDGSNRWPAVHRRDAATLFRLALEKGARGARYNAVGDQGIPLKQIAEQIGSGLHLPVQSIPVEQAEQHFSWMSRFIVFDNPATAHETRSQLGWEPNHIGLLEDMQQHYF